MSWTHSSKVAALGVLLAITVGVAGTAAAVSFTGDAPEPTEVGESVEMSTTVEEPFVDQPDNWTIQGETELENANWFIEIRDAGDNAVAEQEASGQSIEQELSLEENHNTVTITVNGEVPELGEDQFNYEDIEKENYTAMELTRAGGEDGSTLQTYKAHRYTEESQSAREAIDSASEIVEESGGADAQAQLDRAIGAYDSGNFELAKELATDAETTSQQAGQNRQLLLIGGGVVVALIVIGGIVFWWRNREEEAHRLQ